LYKDAILENSVTGLCIELHWAVCEPFFDKALHAATFWEATRAVTVLDTQVLTPSPENLLFLLSIHGARHYWNSLKWICDIDRFVRIFARLDWPQVMDIADRFRRRRTVISALELANDVLGTPLSAGVSAFSEQYRKKQTALTPLQSNLFADRDRLDLGPNESLFCSKTAAEMDISKKIDRLRSKDSLASRLAFAWKLVRDFVRPDDVDREKRPGMKRSALLFWLIQPFRLIRAHGVAFFWRASKSLVSAVVR
jgi:Uncharacterised nucleotidyltransferase